MRPPELLAEAIANPPDGRIKPRLLALVDVLMRVDGRAAQCAAVVAYWRLAVAQGQYHYALAARDRLRRWVDPRHKATALAESQMASAEAAVDDAEFHVLKMAAELSQLAGLTALAAGPDDAERVPWAVDRPHVGAYDLKYDQLFSGRLPPPRLQLIHRTLPIGRRAIDVHGEAVVAAADALDAAEEEYRQGALDYPTLATCLDRLTAQRRSFLQSVLRYNEDIVEYALTVAPATADAKLLASILIRQPAKPALQPAGSPAASPAGPPAAGPPAGGFDPGCRSNATRPRPRSAPTSRRTISRCSKARAATIGPGRSFGSCNYRAVEAARDTRRAGGQRARRRRRPAGGECNARRSVSGTAQRQGRRTGAETGRAAALGPRIAGRIGR